jgi:peptidoglycan/LPS O-acetylase OafA/YrhL
VPSPSTVAVYGAIVAAFLISLFIVDAGMEALARWFRRGSRPAQIMAAVVHLPMVAVYVAVVVIAVGGVAGFILGPVLPIVLTLGLIIAGVSLVSIAIERRKSP